MKKLKLDIDDLKVESFETTKIPDKVGTIQGHQYVIDTDPPNNPCGGGGGGGTIFTSYITQCRTCYRHSCVPTCGGDTCPTSWCQCDYS